MSQQKTLAFFVGLAALLAFGAVAFIAVVMLRGSAIDEPSGGLSWKTKDDLFLQLSVLDLRLVTIYVRDG